MLAGIALVFMAFFPGDTPGGNSLNDHVLGYAKDVLYNYVAWEIDAIVQKIQQLESGIAPFLSERDRAQFVMTYAANVGTLQRLDGQIARIYADPAVTDKLAATADLRNQRDAAKRLVEQQRPLAEAIVESQAAAVLRDEGFGTLGEILPEVSGKITELPMLLVVSPRNVIRRDLAINVVYLSADQMTTLETTIDRNLNVSSIVVPLGGLALYPAMIYEGADPAYLIEVVAHEWSHHYLLFFPLGLEYLDPAGAAWIINETTASQFGKEIAREVIGRFYKGLLTLPPEPTLPPPQQKPTTPQPTPTLDPAKPPPFDFGAEMNTTRITVDKLLAEGKIEEAETYMEAQRKVFVAHGYAIRKLNQAYFAFFGGYQSAGGGGTAGADPIGPAVGEIRQHSANIKAWMEVMRSITSREQLLSVRDSMASK